MPEITQLYKWEGGLQGPQSGCPLRAGLSAAQGQGSPALSRKQLETSLRWEQPLVWVTNPTTLYPVEQNTLFN